MKTQHKILMIISCALATLPVSCSDLKRNLPVDASEITQGHEQGWLDISSVNFHGNAIQNSGWNMNDCKKCHGIDYNGGTSRLSCLNCHDNSDGPENCSTCHSWANTAPPKGVTGNIATIGSHQSHVNSDPIFSAVLCNECHSVPASLTSAGHIDGTGGAEVLFNGAVVQSDLAAFAGPDQPAYVNPYRCNNTYCHGYFPNGNKISPTWNDNTGQFRACGSCHGDPSQAATGSKALPKTSINGGFHPNDTTCSKCHLSAINSSYVLNSAKHVNGKIDYNN